MIDLHIVSYLSISIKIIFFGVDKPLFDSWSTSVLMWDAVSRYSHFEVSILDAVTWRTSHESQVGSLVLLLG